MDDMTNAKPVRRAQKRTVDWSRFQKVRDQKTEGVEAQKIEHIVQPAPEERQAVEEHRDNIRQADRMGSADPADRSDPALKELIDRNRTAPTLNELWLARADMRGETVVKVIEPSIGGFYCLIYGKDKMPRDEISDGRNRIFVPYRDFVKRHILKKTVPAKRPKTYHTGDGSDNGANEGSCRGKGRRRHP